MITPHRHFAPDSLLEPFTAEWLKEQGDRLAAKWRFQSWGDFVDAINDARSEHDLMRILREVNRDKLPDGVHQSRARHYVSDRAKELGIRLGGNGFRWSEKD